MVKLYVGGSPIDIIVDNYFPVTKEGKWACIHSDCGEKWMMVLEKAYAKLHGGYENIKRGKV